MRLSYLENILQQEEEIIICTKDGTEIKILTESVTIFPKKKEVYLRKLKLKLNEIQRIKKIKNEKDEWIIRTLKDKKEKQETTAIIGEDFHVTGKVIILDKNVVMIKAISFDIPVVLKLNKITSIY